MIGNFCVRLKGLRDALRAGKTLLLGASVREFPEACELVNGLEKRPSPMWVGAKGWNRTKGQRKGEFALWLSQGSSQS